MTTPDLPPPAVGPQHWPPPGSTPRGSAAGRENRTTNKRKSNLIALGLVSPMLLFLLALGAPPVLIVSVGITGVLLFMFIFRVGSQVAATKRRELAQLPPMWWEGGGSTAPESHHGVMQPGAVGARSDDAPFDTNTADHGAVPGQAPQPRRILKKKRSPFSVLLPLFVVAALVGQGGGVAFTNLGAVGRNPIFVVIGVVAFVVSWRRWRRGVAMRDTPTTPPSAITIGRVETTGIASLPENAAGVGHDNAVWCEYDVERFVRSSKGGGSWRRQLRITSERPFFVRDGDGQVKICPVGAGAEIEAEISDAVERFSANQLRGLAAKPPAETVFDADQPIALLPGSWRVLYRSIRTGEEITAYGHAVTDPEDPAEAMLAVDSGRSGRGRAMHFSHGKPSEQEQHLGRNLWVTVAVPPLSILYNQVLGFAFTAIGIGAVLVVLTLDVYNRLVTLANQIESTKALIDVALLRRSDLIGNLVETAKAALAEEHELQKALASARIRPSGLERSAAMSDAASRRTAELLGLLVERHPELKTDVVIAKLMQEIIGCENRIASARNVHNQAVALMQARLGSMPYLVFGAKFRGRAGGYFLI